MSNFKKFFDEKPKSISLNQKNYFSEFFGVGFEKKNRIKN